MGRARISHRIGRYGRRNPGRQHIAGGTAAQQRAYEAILRSEELAHRYGSERKRKQVAAATARKYFRNPGALERMMSNIGLADQLTQAESLSEQFHGRPVRDLYDITEETRYDRYGAILGYLIELSILDDGERTATPIRFNDEDAKFDDDTVFVVSNPAGTNIEFVGGDQSIDWERIDGAEAQDKYLVAVGPVNSITYWTDKHHLSGPKSQAYGTAYEHEFADEGGDLPYLIYDRRNVRLLLVGGTYRIEPDGIAG